jgi:hypothetical protein
MSEKPPTLKIKEAIPTAEEIEKEENERYEAWMADHPAVEIVQDSPETCAEKIRECEALLDSFEATHDLDAMRAITQFASREEREGSLRQLALDALAPIFKRLKYLNTQEAFPQETRDTLKVRYEILSQAVGNIIGDKNGKIFDIVVHDRPTPFPS